jgi:hypothetical protein
MVPRTPQRSSWLPAARGRGATARHAGRGSLNEVMPLPEEIRDEAQSLFHDVRVDAIDTEAHADFVIARVVDRGTMRSVRALRRLYGDARIRRFFEERSDRVSPQTRTLWQHHFGLDDGRCTPKSSPRISSPFWRP